MFNYKDQETKFKNEVALRQRIKEAVANSTPKKVFQGWSEKELIATERDRKIIINCK